MTCGPMVSAKSLLAAMLKPMATPAWLKRHHGRNLRTVSGAFVILAPSLDPMDFPRVLPETYTMARIPRTGVTTQMLSFAPTRTKKST